jgi:L-asparaginase II
MTSHPWAVAGPGRLSTALMEAAPGRLVAKGGAEGLECVGDSVTGMGMALKCEDGHSRAVGPALLAVLAHLGWLDPAAGPVAPWRRPIVRNHAGLEVGALEAVVRIHEPAAS